MKSVVTFLARCLGVLCAANASHALGAEWSYDASIYLFATDTDQTITNSAGTIEGTLSFSDALDNLDFAFMGGFGARNGRWSFISDYQYYDLSFSDATPGPAFSDLNTDLEMRILNGYLAYRVHENKSVQVDIASGFRWFSIDTTMALIPDGPSKLVDDDWFDPLVGIRARFPISDQLSGTGSFDYGGFRSGSETWQALLTVDYAMNDSWLLRGGYRYLSIDHDAQNSDFELSQSGLIFGATFRF